MTLTADFCDFAADVSLSDLSPEAHAAAVSTLGNALALMVGAGEQPAVDSTVGALAALRGPDAVPLLGRTDSLPAQWAALVHGFAGHLEDFDDTHPASIVHPGPPVVAAALSAAARSGATGSELLTAVAAGVEVALRVGVALTPDALARGWHMTGVSTGIGAAIAAGRLLRLPAKRLHDAVGIASTQAAGLLEALGTMAKPLHPGKAAANGFEAAVLAGNGLDGPAEPIAGRRGLLALHAGQTDGAAAARDGLGKRWEIEDNEIKPYACGVVSHALIEVATEAARQLAGPPRSVRLTVNPFVLVAMGRTDPVDQLEAKFSATHCFAVGYRYGQAGPPEFADEVVNDASVIDLRRRCVLVPDDSVPRYGVRAEITGDDGTVWRAERDHPPVLDADGVRRKATALTEPVLGERAAKFVELAFRPADWPVDTLLRAGVAEKPAS